MSEKKGWLGKEDVVGVPTRGSGVSEDSSVHACTGRVLLWLSEVVGDGLESSETLHPHATN